MMVTTTPTIQVRTVRKTVAGHRIGPRVAPAIYAGGVDKATLRREMRSIGEVDSATSTRVVEGLFAWLSRRLPGTISAFIPMPGEIDLTPLFDRLPGWRWVLPRVEDDGTLTFRDRDVPRETHRFGMRQPVDRGPVIPITQIDVFLTPGLAFDESGGRLGNGGGFYDRVLSEMRHDAEAVGVTLRRRVVAEVPTEKHDRRVAWLATENGVIDCRTRS